MQKTAVAAADLIGNKIADKVARASKTSSKINLKTNKEEILKEKYVSPTLSQKHFDDVRLKEENF